MNSRLLYTKHRTPSAVCSLLGTRNFVSETLFSFRFVLFVLFTLFITLYSPSSLAQMKIGDNPTSINPATQLHIEKSGLHTVVLDNGNVGIGTMSPAQKLSVVGTIESTSGGFKFPDGTTQTTARGSGVAIGSFSSPGSTGNYSVTGLSFRPRLVRLSLNNTRSGSLGAYATSVCYGAMTSSSQYAIEWYVSVLSRNFHFTDRVIHCSDADATDPKVRAAYVSMNSDGFTINFTTATTGWTVLYEALE